MIAKEERTELIPVDVPAVRDTPPQRGRHQMPLVWLGTSRAKKHAISQRCRWQDNYGNDPDNQGRHCDAERRLPTLNHAAPHQRAASYESREIANNIGIARGAYGAIAIGPQRGAGKFAATRSRRTFRWRPRREPTTPHKWDNTANDKHQPHRDTMRRRHETR